MIDQMQTMLANAPAEQRRMMTSMMVSAMINTESEKQPNINASLASDPVPMLCRGTAGRGRAAAFLGALAPHWSGGLTEGGGSPVDGGYGEEVGAGYVAFLRQLCSWLAGG